MPLDSSVFEKLGVFYLGRSYDLATRTSSDAPLLYDSRDLVTHAVCVGMTGSGKTGLCLALLEEAALDGIPAIIVDPKGDLGNLLLTFPELRGQDFQPWVNTEDARRKGLDPAAFAEEQANMWEQGLATWGQKPERIRTLREKVEMVIYTPGSSSGIPVNVLASFEAPVSDDVEARAERAQTTATSLLGLLKLDTDPLKSREYISPLGTYNSRMGTWSRPRSANSDRTDSESAVFQGWSPRSGNILSRQRSVRLHHGDQQPDRGAIVCNLAAGRIPRCNEVSLHLRRQAAIGDLFHRPSR